MLEHRVSITKAPDRVVIVGGKGFVGATVECRLVANGIDVLSVGRSDFDLRDHRSAAALARLMRPSDAVVFSAARAPCRDLGMMVENMMIVQTMLAALAAAPVDHVVNISSDAVYGDQTVPMTETTAAAPTTLHGAMHLAREIAIRNAVEASLATLRPTLLYGARDPHNGYGPNRFRRAAMKGDDIMLFGKGEERRDHVLIDDLAEIVCRVLAHRSIGTLNIASGEVTSFRDTAEFAVAVARSKSAILTSPRVGPMPHNGYRAFDPTATMAAFPGFTYVGLSDGMRRVQAEVEDVGRASTRG
jgi:UDP-glucose 4-epimerase